MSCCASSLFHAVASVPTPPLAELVVEVPANADQQQMQNIAQAAADAAALAASAELGVAVVASARAEVLDDLPSRGVGILELLLPCKLFCNNSIIDRYAATPSAAFAAAQFVACTSA
jgi:hypothetical protein